MSDVQYTFASFDELTTTQLYSILQLRTEVFVVEQDCVYQDMDGIDQLSMHVMAYRDSELVAYARIIPPGKKYKDAAIGRIVSSPSVRKLGLGRSVVQQSIDWSKQHYPDFDIRISAQCYLNDFYLSFGFKVVSDVYLEDGIDHQEMLLT